MLNQDGIGEVDVVVQVQQEPRMVRAITPKLVAPLHVMRNVVDTKDAACGLHADHACLHPAAIPEPLVDAKVGCLTLDNRLAVAAWVKQLPESPDAVTTRLLEFCANYIDLAYPKPHTLASADWVILNMIDIDKFMAWLTGSDDAVVKDAFLGSFNHMLQLDSVPLADVLFKQRMVSGRPARLVNVCTVVCWLPMVVALLDNMEAKCRVYAIAFASPQILGCTTRLPPSSWNPLSNFMARYDPLNAHVNLRTAAELLSVTTRAHAAAAARAHSDPKLDGQPYTPSAGGLTGAPVRDPSRPVLDAQTAATALRDTVVDAEVQAHLREHGQINTAWLRSLAPQFLPLFRADVEDWKQQYEEANDRASAVLAAAETKADGMAQIEPTLQNACTAADVAKKCMDTYRAMVDTWEESRFDHCGSRSDQMLQHAIEAALSNVVQSVHIVNVALPRVVRPASAFTHVPVDENPDLDSVEVLQNGVALPSNAPSVNTRRGLPRPIGYVQHINGIVWRDSARQPSPEGAPTPSSGPTRKRRGQAEPMLAAQAPPPSAATASSASAADENSSTVAARTSKRRRVSSHQRDSSPKASMR